MDTLVITEEQKNSYLTQGYAIFKNAVPQDLLERWQKKSQQLEQEAITAYLENRLPNHIAVSNHDIKPKVMRYNNLYREAPSLTLKLLSSQPLMMIMRELCGQGCIPLQLDMLYKQQHPHPTVNWHQDAPHSRAYPFLNMGIYLDNADAGDGCLRCVPQSQHQLCDIESLASVHGWNIPDTIEIPAQAGDIIVHDMMVLHGSPPKRTPGARRTLYFECRPIQALQEESHNSLEWIELRKQWMALILAQADQSCWPEVWKQDYSLPKLDNTHIMRAIAEKQEPAIPSHWGAYPVKTNDYPLSADLKSSEAVNNG